MGPQELRHEKELWEKFKEIEPHNMKNKQLWDSYLKRHIYVRGFGGEKKEVRFVCIGDESKNFEDNIDSEMNFEDVETLIVAHHSKPKWVGVLEDDLFNVGSYNDEKVFDSLFFGEFSKVDTIFFRTSGEEEDAEEEKDTKMLESEPPLISPGEPKGDDEESIKLIGDIVNFRGRRYNIAGNLAPNHACLWRLLQTIGEVPVWILECFMEYGGFVEEDNLEDLFRRINDFLLSLGYDFRVGFRLDRIRITGHIARAQEANEFVPRGDNVRVIQLGIIHFVVDEPGGGRDAHYVAEEGQVVTMPFHLWPHPTPGMEEDERLLPGQRKRPKKKSKRKPRSPSPSSRREDLIETINEIVGDDVEDYSRSLIRLLEDANVYNEYDELITGLHLYINGDILDEDLENFLAHLRQLEDNRQEIINEAEIARLIAGINDRIELNGGLEALIEATQHGDDWRELRDLLVNYNRGDDDFTIEQLRTLLDNLNRWQKMNTLHN